jgi:DNA-binding transcriptional LysR family regulator
VARVRAARPGLKVTGEEGAADELAPRVRSGELHIAVTFQDAALPRDEPPDLERCDLLRERFLVALPPGHPLAARQSVALADLADDDWTVATPDGLIARACRAAGFEPRLVSITRDQLAIRALLQRGLAVTLAPELLAEAFRDVVMRPIAGPAPRRDVYALLPSGGRPPVAEAALEALTALSDEIRAGSP